MASPHLDHDHDLPLSPPSDHKPSPDLPAPPGWLKKISSSRKGSPVVYFISPDGEELKSKRAIDQYLKAHPGGPAASDFDWSTGETPTRRSSRLSSKVRPSPESGSTGKRARQKVEKTPPKAKKTKEEESEPEKTAGGEEVAAPPSDEKADEIMEEAEKGETEGAAGDGTACEKEEKVEDVKTETTQIETADGKATEIDSSHPAECDSKTEDVNGSSGNKEGDIKENLDDKKDEEPKGNAEEENKESELKEENLVDKSEEELKECSESLKKDDLRESSESKNDGLKESSVFQHCPEAPEASRQVDVSS